MFILYIHSGKKIPLSSEIRLPIGPDSPVLTPTLPALAFCAPATLTLRFHYLALQPIRKLTKSRVLLFCWYHSSCSRCHVWLIISTNGPNFSPVSSPMPFGNALYTDSGSCHVTCSSHWERSGFLSCFLSLAKPAGRQGNWYRAESP